LVFNWLFDTAARQRSLPPRFHSELAAAVTGTVEGADCTMRAHIRHGMQRVMENMDPSTAENGWRLPRKIRGRGVKAEQPL
jgi:DNA-binding GntR family transcriptional regulator